MLLQQYNQSRFETGYKIEKKYPIERCDFFIPVTKYYFCFGYYINIFKKRE